MRQRLLCACLAAALPAQEPPTVQFSTTTRMAILDVTVKDRSGKAVADLKAEDFQVLENGQEQKIAVFEFQRLGVAATAAAGTRPTAPRGRGERGQIQAQGPGKVQYQDRRLIALYFDFASMPPEDQARAQRGALRFVEAQMTGDDLMAVLVNGARLRVEQDFTDNRERLKEVLRGFRIGEAAGLATDLAGGDPDLAADSGAAYEPDETEFQLFNTDRKLAALENAARMLGALPEKKALVYFSSGIGKTGIENVSQLRAAVNAAVRANVSFYPVDARGLVAMAPGGDAARGAPKGSGLFSGKTQFGLMDSLRAQQQTLYTLAADSGGRAITDSNDLSEGIALAQKAIDSYYVLGYYSTNPAEDGRFRRTEVRLRDPQHYRLDYRSGYFAPKGFEKMTGTDKERQLEDALLSGDRVNELTLALEVNSFRLAPERYFAAVALKIPGAQIPLARKGGDETTSLDFIGQVRDGRGALAATVRDEIRVQLDAEAAARQRRGHLQYDTGFTLAPGEYRLRFLVRENQSGRMGVFETAFRAPESWPGSERISLSSVVWGAQREALAQAAGRADHNQKRMAAHPLVRDGAKLIPSITRVFRRDQTLIAYAEVYAPSTSSDHPQPSAAAAISLYRGAELVRESEAVTAGEFAARRNGAVALEARVGLRDLPAGRYVAQFNVFDRIAQTFAQRRANVVILP